MPILIYACHRIHHVIHVTSQNALMLLTKIFTHFLLYNLGTILHSILYWNNSKSIRSVSSRFLPTFWKLAVKNNSGTEIKIRMDRSFIF